MSAEQVYNVPEEPLAALACDDVVVPAGGPVPAHHAHLPRVHHLLLPLGQLHLQKKTKINTFRAKMFGRNRPIIEHCHGKQIVCKCTGMPLWNRVKGTVIIPVLY